MEAEFKGDCVRCKKLGVETYAIEVAFYETSMDMADGEFCMDCYDDVKVQITNIMNNE